MYYKCKKDFNLGYLYYIKDGIYRSMEKNECVLFDRHSVPWLLTKEQIKEHFEEVVI